MSEFSVGTLFLSEQLAFVADWMRQQSMAHYVRKLNDKFGILFLEDDWLGKPKTVEMLRDLSRSVPLLYHVDAEDHGWEYRIFADGVEVASFENDYFLDHETIMDRARDQIPPDADPMLYIYGSTEGMELQDRLLEEIHLSREYLTALAQQFGSKNVASFKLFGYDDSVIAQLDHLLSLDGLETPPEPRVSVGRFHSTLGIREFNYLSYDYTVRDIQRGPRQP